MPDTLEMGSNTTRLSETLGAMQVVNIAKIAYFILVLAGPFIRTTVIVNLTIIIF